MSKDIESTEKKAIEKSEETTWAGQTYEPAVDIYESEKALVLQAAHRVVVPAPLDPLAALDAAHGELHRFRQARPARGARRHRVGFRQGERADYVFNMSAGEAEVLVDDVIVGRVGEGEIFGAMAVLTHADRSATVRARTACSVVKVPKEQFTELIKRNPTTIHSLLVDMANSIVNLNEHLVGLRGDNGQRH